ncbi:MAG: 2-thiouracil desulfurase family protein [Bacteroidales bacterium]
MNKYLFQPATGKDVTKEMQVFIADFLNELKNIDGIILKHRSPSCGLHNVKTYIKDSGKGRDN